MSPRQGPQKRDVLLVQLNFKEVVLTYGSARAAVACILRGLEDHATLPETHPDLDKLEKLLRGGLHDE